MPDMFAGDDQDNRKHDEDRVDVEFREREIRELEKAGLKHRGEIHHAEKESGDIAADDGDQDRDDGQESAEGHASDGGHAQSHQKDYDIVHAHHIIKKSRGTCGRARKFKPDQRHYRPHRGWRKDHRDPFGPELLNDEGNQATEEAHCDEAAKRIFIAELADDQIARRDKRKAAPEISRRLPAGDPDEKQCADPVHEKNDGGIEAEKKRHQHGCPEHREQMLKAQREKKFCRNLLIHLVDLFFHVNSLSVLN